MSKNTKNFGIHLRVCWKCIIGEIAHSERSDETIVMYRVMTVLDSSLRSEWLNILIFQQAAKNAESSEAKYFDSSDVKNRLWYNNQKYIKNSVVGVAKHAIKGISREIDITTIMYEYLMEQDAYFVEFVVRKPIFRETDLLFNYDPIYEDPFYINFYQSDWFKRQDFARKRGKKSIKTSCKGKGQ